MSVRARICVLRTVSVLLAAFSAFSCSTTKVLQDGEYRLAKNTIKVEGDKRFNTRALEPYLKQQANSYFAFGWSPALNIYNWQNGKGKGWDKFVTKIGTPPVVYDSDLVDSSEENVEKHLEYLGYYNSDVTADVSVKKRRVYVKYNVNLGKQYPIKSLTWNVPSGAFEEVFNADSMNISIKPGMPLSESLLEGETVRSSRHFRDNGFYGFTKSHYFFEADTLAAPDSAVLHMDIKEYTRNSSEAEAKPLEQYRIGDVSVSLPATLKFRPKVLNGLTTLRSGNLYSETDVNNTYSRLSALKTFSGVNVEMKEAGDNTVDCDITLTQAKLQGMKLNLEASTNSTGLFGISPQLSWYHKNIFHGGEWLNVSVMGNFQFKFKDKIHSTEVGVSAGLSFPRFLGLPYRLFKGPSVPRTDVNLSYNYQNRPEYTRNIVSASYGYSGSYRNCLLYKVYPAQLNIVHLNKIDDSFYNSLKNDPFLRNAYQDHFDLGMGGILYYATSMDTNPQDSYFYTRLQLDLAGNLLSAFKGVMKKDENGAGILWNTPFSQFVRGELTVGQTWKFGKNNGQAIAVRALAGAGLGYGNSSALPFEKHFYAGGASSLRGWQARAVGPGLSPMDTTFVIPNQTGDMKLEANLEYRFDMVWKLEGAVFVDAGNIWTLRKSYDGEGEQDDGLSQFRIKDFGKSIAMNWGLGLRLDFNIIVIRVDWGMKIHEPSRENPWLGPKQWFKRDGYAIHFGVGYPF